MTTTAEWWAGEAGDQYHNRNRVDWRKRIPFWKDVLDLTGARSVYEWGCGPGWNLTAIKVAAEWPVEVYGYDVNVDAVNQAASAGLDVDKFEWHGPFELVCTVGALIHVPPVEIKTQMERIIESSCDYVLAVEYEADKEAMIEYRGEKDLLWKRPYGKLYRDLGLNMVASGGAGEGFDNCQFWLLRK